MEEDKTAQAHRRESAEQLARELERILFSGILQLQSERNVTREMRFGDFDFTVTWYGKPYLGGRLFERISLTVGWNGEVISSDHEDETKSPDDDAPGGAKTQAALDAMTAIWPDGIRGVAVKDRNRMIVDWCREHRRSIPSERTIERVAADIARP
jgi:hypothetical protein